MDSRHRTRLAGLALAATLLAGTGVKAESVLRMGVIGRLAGAHPDMQTGGSTHAIGGFAARALTYFDGHIEMACLLCETLPTEDNGLVTPDRTPNGEPGQRVLFRLRPGLAWDDGQPVTADDFVLAWEVGRDPRSGYAWRSRLQDEIWQVRAIDARTLEVRRRGVSCTPSDFRFAPLPRRLEGARWASAPDRYRQSSHYVAAPATPGLYAGPYRVAEYAPEGEAGRATLLRNPHWPGPRPRYDRIELIYRPTAAAMAEAVGKGEVDLVTDAAPAVLAAAEGRNPPLKPVLRPGRALLQVALNLDDRRLADLRVRQALLLAIDRDRLAADIGGGAAATQSVLTPRSPAFEPLLPRGGPEAWPRARRLLAAAGWRLDSDGVRRNVAGEALRLRLAVQPSRLDSPPVRRLVESWRAIGVAVDVEPWGGLGQLTGPEPPPLALFGYTLEGGRHFDGLPFESGSIPQPGEVRNGMNVFRYRSASADAYARRLREACGADAQEALRGLQRRIVADLPLLPLVVLPEAHLLPPDLAAPDTTRVQLLLPHEVERWRMSNARP